MRTLFTSACWRASVAGILLLAACTPVPPVPTPGPGATDATAPLLRLGSVGLRRDLLLTQDATTTETRRARSRDDVVFLATATDSETGVRRVRLGGQLKIVCVPATGINIITIAEPIFEEQVAAAGATLPGQLARQFRLAVAAQRARCPAGSRFLELALDLWAEAENGVGQVRRLPSALVGSFGPDTLRVGAFNLYQPGNHPDSTYTRWGRTLGAQVDLLLLSEVADRRRAELVAAGAGMPYLMVLQDNQSDVAILSRAPIRNVQRRVIDPPGNLTSNNSNILSVETDIGGWPHQVIATHWGIRDANDVQFPAETSAPGRVEAAQTMVGLLKPSPAIAIVGGDLNAYSGVGPQVVPGGTTEVATLSAALTDAFVAAGAPGDRYCSNQRIDYIFFRGSYAVADYNACHADAGPSDHPYVMVTLVAE